MEYLPRRGEGEIFFDFRYWFPLSFSFTLQTKEKESGAKKKKTHAVFLRPLGVLTKLILRARPHSFCLANLGWRDRDNLIISKNKITHSIPQPFKQCSAVTTRACARHNSECKRFGETEPAIWSERLKGVEALRDSFFLWYFLFFLPRN